MMSRPSRDDLEREVLRLMHAMDYGFPADLGMDSDWRNVWDSLEEIDFILRVELEFDITVPDSPVTDAQRGIWDRRPLRVRDFVDLVELQWGTGCPGVARCMECRYDLTGVAPGTCPECGTDFRRLLVR
jgi:acyl carrier protein